MNSEEERGRVEEGGDRKSEKLGTPRDGRRDERTFKAETKSAASNSVKVEIWSTMASILGLSELGAEAAGGGGGVEEAVVGVGSASVGREVERKARGMVGRMVDLG